jgi:cell wall assembly regulator SMI1
MDDAVRGFSNDLKSVLERFPDHRFKPVAGASRHQIASLEQVVGIQFDEALKSLWEFSNGSGGDSWFGVRSDEDTPCSFLSIDDALKLWREWNGLGEKWGGQGMPDRNERDPRIRPDWQLRWFPVGEFNGGSTMILFDAAPSSRGRYGQIVVYQHDPDAVYFVADDTAAFLKISPEILRRCLEELQDN